MTTSEIESSHFDSANCHETSHDLNYKKNTSSSDWSLKIDLYQELRLADIQADENAALLALSAGERKRKGVFFTPFELSKLSVEKFNYSVTDGVVLDPACGTGNLLLALADSFEVLSSLEATLQDWNSRLFGIDINYKFVDIAKRKIVRLALDKGAAPLSGVASSDVVGLLSNIRVGDFLTEHQRFVGVVDGVIMNPPFCHMEASSDIEWTSGKFNAAALFVLHAIGLLPDGGKFLGILPDVLRSGTRYSEWRDLLLSYSNSTMETFGNFQRGVQVDVFILQGVKDRALDKVAEESLASPIVHAAILKDRFDVSVGPVVPHRDKVEGVEAPFAHAKILPPWETVDSLGERICHSGRKFDPPFVAVRRTSSPKDRYRAVGTIVNCEEPVAVENHIIVLSPKNRSLRSCQRLLEFLRSQFVNDYINSEIRCRHLTVSVVKGIPLEGMIDGD